MSNGIGKFAEGLTPNPPKPYPGGRFKWRIHHGSFTRGIDLLSLDDAGLFTIEPSTTRSEAFRHRLHYGSIGQ